MFQHVPARLIMSSMVKYSKSKHIRQSRKEIKSFSWGYGVNEQGMAASQNPKLLVATPWSIFFWDPYWLNYPVADRLISPFLLLFAVHHNTFYLYWTFISLCGYMIFSSQIQFAFQAIIHVLGGPCLLLLWKLPERRSMCRGQLDNP